MEGSLTGLPLPIVLRPPSPLSDEELIAFSRRNRSCRVERTPKEDLVIKTPVGRQGGTRDIHVVRMLAAWAEQDGRGQADGPNTWMSDPFARTVTVYRPTGEPEELAAPAGVLGEGPVDGFRLTTEKLWAA